MTTFYLARHGATTAGPVLYGRAPGVSLSEEGLRQAEALAEHLRRVPLEAVYATPIERAVHTAERIAARHGVDVQRVEQFTEVDWGEWTDRPFEELERDETWRRFHLFRSGTRIPGGESMSEVQTRMVHGLERLRGRHPEGTVAVVGHADPLRTALAYYLGMPLDLMQRLKLDHAGYSVLILEPWGSEVRCLNASGVPPGP
jgi:broad specificity phosphatase PhoE